MIDHSLDSAHKLATVAKIADSPDGERARVRWNEEVPEGVEPPVLFEAEQDGESRSDGRKRGSYVFTLSGVGPHLAMRPFLSSMYPW